MDNFYAYIPLILKYIVILPYFLKDSKQVLRGQWNGLNYVTLIFNNPKFYRRCILLNKNDEIIVTGQIFNTLNIPKNRAFCSINVKWFKKWKE
ncbi:hypothetical protein [Spiroplasma ixodetis]|uniref:Spiroplasmavirus-related protein n=1 Tax=Spiroplasma ixodetis TaxID=2141 RepID=A0ABN6T2T7_9MOLU|nr:hypothetical protein [Spiroplasma ixodetis]BDT03452.1 hypothetical protein SHM_10980 [Spiroplasma ixodetis]